MASKSLLTGYGDQYTSEAITGNAAGAVGVDTIDTSLASQFAIQITAATTPGGSTLQVQQTFDGTNWADLGAAIAVSLGAVSRFPITNGPYGKIRLKVIDAAAAAVVTSVITGFGTQWCA